MLTCYLHQIQSPPTKLLFVLVAISDSKLLLHPILPTTAIISPLFVHGYTIDNDGKLGEDEWKHNLNTKVLQWTRSGHDSKYGFPMLCTQGVVDISLMHLRDLLEDCGRVRSLNKNLIHKENVAVSAPPLRISSDEGCIFTNNFHLLRAFFNVDSSTPFPQTTPPVAPPRPSPSLLTSSSLLVVVLYLFQWQTIVIIIFLNNASPSMGMTLLTRSLVTATAMTSFAMSVLWLIVVFFIVLTMILVPCTLRCPQDPSSRPRQQIGIAQAMSSPHRA